MTPFAMLMLVVVGPPLCAMVAGRWIARIHERTLARREAELVGVRVDNRKTPADPRSVADSRLVSGHVVLSSDPLGVLTTRVRTVFGGEARAATGLLDRARREALVRLREDARAMGAAEVCNVRFDTASISRMRRRSSSMQVEVLASGTAVVRDRRFAPAL